MGEGVAVDEKRQRAAEPEDLSRLFLERANAGDVEGLVELYEPGAVLAFPPGQLSTGSEAIRAAYEKLLAGGPTFGAGDQHAAIRNDTGDLALTSTRLAGRGATAEVARRQPDGSWLWIIDQPAVLG
jgi:ketosteroid isomerase-like protein